MSNATIGEEVGSDTHHRVRLSERIARDYPTVALILQGGGALGAYQAGVYQGLHEASIRPNWFAGISIGAINAAILAGNAPEQRMERLNEFWKTVCQPALIPTVIDIEKWMSFIPGFESLRGYANWLVAQHGLIGGQLGFFSPRMVPPWFSPDGTAAATSFYDTQPLKSTLERLIDFDRIRHGDVRLSVGAVNVRTGNLIYFDSARQRIRVEHIMASAALPPGFPAVEIEGELYWDGGVVSNTPLEFVFDEQQHNDTLVFQVDLWSALGALPQDIAGVLMRQKDIQYSSRTRRGTDAIKQRQQDRCLVSQLLDKLNGNLQNDPIALSLRDWST